MVPKIFADTNIFIDFIAQRPLQINYTNDIFRKAEALQLNLLVSESVIINGIYVTNRIEEIKKALLLVNLISISKTYLLKALNSEFRDKEDAILYYGAIENKAEFFITRNKKDFIKNGNNFLPIFT
ncbi:MAG: PIN domain-containing protein [Ferruginibacter sp.]